jgi:hypothetical protein
MFPIVGLIEGSKGGGKDERNSSIIILKYIQDTRKCTENF